VLLKDKAGAPIPKGTPVGVVVVTGARNRHLADATTAIVAVCDDDGRALVPDVPPLATPSCVLLHCGRHKVELAADADAVVVG
jgi:hypothetical protein